MTDDNYQGTGDGFHPVVSQDTFDYLERFMEPPVKLTKQQKQFWRNLNIKQVRELNKKHNHYVKNPTVKHNRNDYDENGVNA